MKRLLPDKDHPVWKLAQSLVVLLTVGLLVLHGYEGEHKGLIPDGSDLAGVAGLGLAGKLLYQQFIRL